MASHACCAALAALTTLALTIDAGAVSNFCKPAVGTGKATLNFETKPAMVVEDDGTMAATFAEAGLTPIAGASPDSSVFSFSHTMDALLLSAGEISPSMDENARQPRRVALVDKMLDTLRTDQPRLNAASGLILPLDDRSAAEGAMSAERLLNPADTEQGMQPRALFNRFDLAPADWSHCGEFRVVYTTPEEGVENNRRLLLIFEAMMPNPAFKQGDPEESEAGCRAIAEYWAGLPAGEDDASVRDRAAALSRLYYEGVPGVTTLKPQAANPVLSFRNLGGDGNRGQVRANMFFGGEWQLREWLVQRTVDGLGFVPVTVKDNPIAELTKDDLGGTPLATANIGSVVQSAHADFVAHFFGEVNGNLLTERSLKYQDLVAALKRIDAGALDEDDILVTLIGLGSDDRFNDFESISQPGGDELSAAGDKFKTALGLLNASENLVATGIAEGILAQEAQVILARAEAGTCSGCHQSSQSDVVSKKPDRDVLWPDAVGGGFAFVHVHENGTLSPALEDHFLPTRRLIMGTHLCKTLSGPAQNLASSMAELAAQAETQAATDTTGESDIPQEIHYSDDFLRRFSAAAAADDDDGGPSMAASNMAVTIEGERILLSEPAIEALAAEIQERREIERNTPGAFVEVRRPH